VCWFSRSREGLQSATNCGNVSNSHNVNDTEIFYSVTEDPLRDFVC